MSVDAGPCIALVRVLPGDEFFDVTGGELDVVNYFGTSDIESAQNSVIS